MINSAFKPSRFTRSFTHLLLLRVHFHGAFSCYLLLLSSICFVCVYIFFMYLGLSLSLSLSRSSILILLIVKRVRKIVLFSRLAKFHFLRMFYVNVYVNMYIVQCTMCIYLIKSIGIVHQFSSIHIYDQFPV